MYAKLVIKRWDIIGALNKKDQLPVMLTTALMIVSFIAFFISRLFSNVNVWFLIVFLLVVAFGHVIALVLGIQSKHVGVKIFSILTNSLFFLVLSFILFLLFIAAGISGS